jgi:protein tyrosine phosphatase (PTP) superfamily phosphohydrolase (DUF442 family)
MHKHSSQFSVSVAVGLAVMVPAWVLAAPDGKGTDGKGPENKAPAQATTKAAQGPAKPLEIEGVHNAFQWTEKIVTGSCPHGDAGFKALAARGVKTIVTVDGAVPELPAARKYGMRYVHIPVEYSGIAEKDALRIARAVRDLPGPVFIHCHHGIHRGPAAAALAAIALGAYNREEALAALKQAGTGANYQGLWNDVRNFKQPDKATLDKADNSFPEAAPVPAMAAAMVNIDLRWEHLRAVQAANWQAPADHPDIDPAHEALLLRESFRELARSDEMKKFPADFSQKMQASETASAALEAALRAKEPEKAKAAFDAVKASCSGCHAPYRDNKTAKTD